jgi:peptide/nickel transport system ATP-binding protein
MTVPLSGAAAAPQAPIAPLQTGALLLETKDLRVRFNVGSEAIEAVDGLSYRLLAGKTLAIVGESGAGKTVSCRALTGLLSETAIVTGSAMFMGTELLGLPEREMRTRRGRQIAMAFQDASRSLNPTMRIGEQIYEAICAHERTDWVAARQRALELLRIPAPNACLLAYPHQLSGGMRQRVMLAIAVAAKPKLLIADEPTSSLDSITRVLVMGLLGELQKRFGMALILISHDLDIAAAVADDVLVMRAGKTIEYAPADELLAGPRMAYTKALFDDLRAPRPPQAKRPGAVSSLERSTAWSTLVAERGLKTAHGRNEASRNVATAARASNVGSEFELEARDIVQQYRVRGATVHALSNVSLGIRRGEVLGLVGETGSGKTTLARVLLGLQPPTSGSVLFRGRDMTRRRDPRKPYVQAVFQDPFGSLDPKWRVAEIVEEPLVGYRIGDAKKRRRRVEEVLRLVNLPADIARRRPRQLSGGEAQRVAIARALAPGPAVLVCDEALSSLDAITRREVLSVFRAHELACLFISHDLAAVQQVCDRIAVLHLGQLCEIGPTDVLRRAPAHPYTRALAAARMPMRHHDRGAAEELAYVNARESPSPTNPPPGCRFHTRCVRAAALCASEEPQLGFISRDHLVACHSPLPCSSGSQ